MKEEDYINATNLTKLRNAVGILREVVAQDDDEDTARLKAIRGIQGLINVYEKKVTN